MFRFVLESKEIYKSRQPVITFQFFLEPFTFTESMIILRFLSLATYSEAVTLLARLKIARVT